LQQQRDAIYRKICTALSFIGTDLVREKIEYLHPIFIAKAARSNAVSSSPVAQQLVNPRDPFSLGTSYWDPATLHTQDLTSTVAIYPDDTVIY
jgi:hypothetical protein